MKNFTLKQLQYFVAAGELCSVTQAAQKLHVSQPSISSAIQKIEDMSGLQLFIRHHAQGLSLTSAGQQLLKHAKQLLHDAEGLTKFAASLRDEIGGDLKLVAFPTFSPRFLPRILKRYSLLYPSVSLFCDEMNQPEIVTGLREGEYELAFTYNLGLPPDISFSPIYELSPYAIVSEDHELSDRNSVKLADLIRHPLVLLDLSLSREYYLSLFTKKGLQPTIAHRAKSIEMVRGLVSNGFGFSILNTPLSKAESHNNGRLKRIKLEGVDNKVQVGLANLKNTYLSPAAKAMMDFVIDIDHTQTTTPER